MAAARAFWIQDAAVEWLGTGSARTAVQALCETFFLETWQFGTKLRSRVPPIVYNAPTADFKITHYL